MAKSEWNRRCFLKVLGSAVASAGVSPCAFGDRVIPASIVVAPDDPTAAEAPVSWAIAQLTRALEDQGVRVSRVPRMADGDGSVLRLVVAGAEHPRARQILHEAKAEVPATP